MMRKQDSTIKSAGRVLDVLELLCRRANSASHTEIAFTLDIPKSSLSVLLKNLVQRNYLEKNIGNNSYQLGPAFFALSKQGKTAKNILKITKNQLVWLTEKTREASAFYLFKGNHIERVLGEEANYPLSYRMTPNVKFTLYAAAAGKAVLNCLPESEKNTYFKQTKITPLTNQTATTEAQIRQKLIADTKNKVTISYGENSVGVIALAIPILREDHIPIGALSIVVPEVRFTEKLEILCRESLITAATKVDYELQTI